MLLYLLPTMLYCRTSVIVKILFILICSRVYILFVSIKYATGTAVLYEIQFVALLCYLSLMLVGVVHNRTLLYLNPA